MPFQNWFHRTQKTLERSPTLIQPYWFNRSSGLGGLDNKSCMTWRPFITFNNRIALKYLIFFFIQTSKRKIEKTVLHNFDKRMQQWEDNKALKTCHCVWKKAFVCMRTMGVCIPKHSKLPPNRNVPGSIPSKRTSFFCWRHQPSLRIPIGRYICKRSNDKYLPSYSPSIPELLNYQSLNEYGRLLL